MSDLISRQAAINAVEARIKWFNGDAIEDRCKRDAFIQVIDEILTALPSADAVEVVRCKDCKHYQNEHICQYFSRFGTIETSSYAYCAYGERREP